MEEEKVTDGEVPPCTEALPSQLRPFPHGPPRAYMLPVEGAGTTPKRGTEGPRDPAASVLSTCLLLLLLLLRMCPAPPRQPAEDPTRLYSPKPGEAGGPLGPLTDEARRRGPRTGGGQNQAPDPFWVSCRNKPPKHTHRSQLRDTRNATCLSPRRDKQGAALWEGAGMWWSASSRGTGPLCH